MDSLNGFTIGATLDHKLVEKGQREFEEILRGDRNNDIKVSTLSSFNRRAGHTESNLDMNINDSEVSIKARENQPLFLQANYKSANINAGLLFVLSKAGRAVLAYLIDKMDIEKGDIIFPRVDILNYISNNADLGATTTTVNRGIKDLIDNGVVVQDKYIDSMYHINKNLVWQ